ncbi:unsaturated rhamnogalacturonyl hydrolase [Ciceribacter lividus]|uniref:Unsaturated rhamnogalacturonyl hydrolase n=1 Tax=Ciceribacter lividus TaxID=1197950 RepID=A0A6I7HMD0_9HYPH|nr:glycoside hydrolase family 88 protein [Ciceribacter lividus]RCW25847.1 unsaturated rhamnogalacturonyl hydrolase [Ciceribacter lividus]
MLSTYFDSYARDYAYYKGGAWCYEDGCLYRGLSALHDATGDGRWLDHLVRLVNGQIDPTGEIRGYAAEEYNIDNLLPGRALLYLDRHTHDPRYRAATEHLAIQLEEHPRIAVGCYWHKLRYPHQVWLDGLYMTLPFKVELGRATDRPALVADATRQMLTALTLTFDEKSRLYRHGYDERRQQPWADKDTGLSPTHWARAIGWMAMALVDLVECLPAGSERDTLASHLRELSVRLKQLRTPDGRWLQVIDQPDLPDNYAESSATAMFAYAYLKAARLGVAGVDPEIGQAAFRSLQENALRPDGKDRIVLWDVCCVAGLGGLGGVYRDGTPAYYLSEPLQPDDVKGVGPLMMAEAERLRLSQAALADRR